MNIAIIGAGEVGRTYAKAVAEQSAHTAILCDPYPTDKTLRLASEAGLDLHRQAGTWLADTDRVWLCVTGDLALSACSDLLSHLRPAAVIVDLTTAAPADKQTAFHLAVEHHIQYVDAVILGAIALTGAATPLLAAGPAGEEAMRDFVGLGAPSRVLPQARPGDAAALKLLRTILTKGLEALAVECLVAAEKQGIRAELYEAMSDVDAAGFASFLDMLVRTHIQHSERRWHEVQRAEAQLTSLGLPATMLSASQEVFARTTRSAAENPPPGVATTDVNAALKWLESTSTDLRSLRAHYLLNPDEFLFSTPVAPHENTLSPLFSNAMPSSRFAPFGFHGIFAALPLGIVFSVAGFEQAIQVGGEAGNPQRNIPRAVILSMIIGTLIYLLLEVAFVGALNPANLVHGWANPISGVAAFGPYATLATAAGLGWLTMLLIIDAVISPAGTGLVYFGTSSRLSYGLGRNGYFPPAISRISRRGVPFVSICISFVVGMLVFLPFPSWGGLVGLITSALVLMYAMAPLSLAGLRRQDPDRPRSYRLPAAGALCPLAFICADMLVYFAGFSTVFWLYVLIALGFAAFALYQASLPAGRRTIIDRRAAAWIIPWLAGLIIISWLGRYNGSPPTVFGVTLLATKHLPNWWDLLVLAAFSLGIYYWAVHSTMSHQHVHAAVEELETEASVELETSLA